MDDAWVTVEFGMRGDEALRPIRKALGLTDDTRMYRVEQMADSERCDFDTCEFGLTRIRVVSYVPGSYTERVDWGGRFFDFMKLVAKAL